MLDSPKVSRRHAIINVQNVGEFWLIDLGSSNGTFLNKRRVHQPVRLCDQHQIVIGDSVFAFRHPMEISDDYRSTLAEGTIREYYRKIHPVEAAAVDKNLAEAAAAAEAKKKAAAEAAAKAAAAKAAAAKTTPA